MDTSTPTQPPVPEGSISEPTLPSDPPVAAPAAPDTETHAPPPPDPEGTVTAPEPTTAP